jgi:hypothetical protein
MTMEKFIKKIFHSPGDPVMRVIRAKKKRSLQLGSLSMKVIKSKKKTIPSDQVKEDDDPFTW